MSIKTATRLDDIKPSATLTIEARSKELRASGKDIISLSAGEPDFATPDFIKQAAIDAINQNFTKYTAVDGLPALKQAIVEKFTRDNNLTYAPDEIIVSTGAKQCVFNLALALLNPGDEVIIPAPYWVSYPEIVKVTGANPVIISGSIEQSYKITAEQLAAAITPKTKLFIINSPSNPSGICYTHQELKSIAEVLLAHPQIVIMSDDIYEKIIWTQEPFANLLMLCPELQTRTVLVNGASKTYAMTGWRIGYAAGPKPLINAMKKIQGQSTSNPNTIAQYATIAAINHDQQPVTKMVQAFHERHDFLLKQLLQIPGIQCLPSGGTFYSFPNVSAAYSRLKGIENDVQFAELLINEVGLAVVPGTAFGMPGCLRLSFACDIKTLEQAIQRLKQALANTAHA